MPISPNKMEKSRALTLWWWPDHLLSIFFPVLEPKLISVGLIRLFPDDGGFSQKNRDSEVIVRKTWGDEALLSPAYCLRIFAPINKFILESGSRLELNVFDRSLRIWSRQLPRSKSAVNWPWAGIHKINQSCSSHSAERETVIIFVNRSDKFQNKESVTFHKMKSEWRNVRTPRTSPYLGSKHALVTCGTSPFCSKEYCIGTICGGADCRSGDNGRRMHLQEISRSNGPDQRCQIFHFINK